MKGYELMGLGDKLIQLRREHGYSQEQLANMLDVSRQSVSKWESEQSIPEINKLIVMADIFAVTVDSLVRNDQEILPIELRQNKLESSNNAININSHNPAIPYRYGFYEYKSKTKVLGIPLVHIKTGYGVQVAKGIIAIGNISIGLISIGGLSVGGICIGGISLGLLAIAGLALGGLAIGGAAIGIFALGGFALGMYSVGGIVIASRIGIGGLAYGPTAIGTVAKGEYTLKVTETVSKVQVRNFILEHNPRIWRPLLKFLAFMGEMVGLT